MELSESENERLSWYIVVTTGTLTALSLLASTIILGIAFQIYRNPRTRKLLEKMSLQILLQFQAVTVSYGIVYIMSLANNSRGRYCSALGASQAFTLTLLGGLCASININLQLIVNHNTKPGLEKYLILASWLTAAFTTLPGLIKGKFGYDPVQDICWINVPVADMRNRILWELILCDFWAILHSAAGLISGAVVVCKILVVRRNIAHAGRKNRTILDSASNCKPCCIILKIMLFPILKAQVTIWGVGISLYLDQTGGIKDGTGYVLFFLAEMLLASVGLVFAIALILVEPAFMSGFMSLLCFWRPCPNRRGLAQDHRGSGNSIRVGAHNMRTQSSPGSNPSGSNGEVGESGGMRRDRYEEFDLDFNVEMFEEQPISILRKPDRLTSPSKSHTQLCQHPHHAQFGTPDPLNTNTSHIEYEEDGMDCALEGAPPCPCPCPCPWKYTVSDTQSVMIKGHGKDGAPEITICVTEDSPE